MALLKMAEWRAWSCSPVAKVAMPQQRLRLCGRQKCWLSSRRQSWLRERKKERTRERERERGRGRGRGRGRERERERKSSVEGEEKLGRGRGKGEGAAEVEWGRPTLNQKWDSQRWVRIKKTKIYTLLLPQLWETWQTARTQNESEQVPVASKRQINSPSRQRFLPQPAKAKAIIITSKLT